MASVEAIYIPEKATSLHIQMMFEMPAQDVTFSSAEATVNIQPAEKENKEKGNSG